MSRSLSTPTPDASWVGARRRRCAPAWCSTPSSKRSGPAPSTATSTCPGWSCTPTPAHKADSTGRRNTSIAFTERVAEAGAAPSVGTVGDAYDNALAESTIGLFKTELITPRGPWRTVEQVEIATREYVDWFNHRRLHSTCGDIPPAELEAAHYRQHRPLPDPAKSNP